MFCSLRRPRRSMSRTTAEDEPSTPGMTTAFRNTVPGAAPVPWLLHGMFLSGRPSCAYTCSLTNLLFLAGTAQDAGATVCRELFNTLNRAFVPHSIMISFFNILIPRILKNLWANLIDYRTFIYDLTSLFLNQSNIYCSAVDAFLLKVRHLSLQE